MSLAPRVDVHQQGPSAEKPGHEADGEVGADPACSDVGAPEIHGRQAGQATEALDRGAGDARSLRLGDGRREGRGQEGHDRDG
jgi:hypothetical protein